MTLLATATPLYSIAEIRAIEAAAAASLPQGTLMARDRKSTRLNSSHWE